MPTKRPLPVLVPERLRAIPRSFAWIDHRLRSGGCLRRMAPEEVALYLFLSLAADRGGLSCWRLDRIERELPFDVGALRRAREGLVAKGLDPSAFQAGQLTGTHARTSKRGSPYLRRAYYLAAMSLYRRHADLNRCCARHRRNGHTHTDALVIVAHKLARIAWRMLTDRRPFRKRPPRRTRGA